MPKDEFDFDDPMELNGVALLSDQDTTDAMCECFIEEFMRLGYNHKQVLALFRNPHYLGMNMVLQNRGEQFVRDAIREIFARWGRPFEWPKALAPECVTKPQEQSIELEGCLKDPMGAPLPKLTI